MVPSRLRVCRRGRFDDEEAAARLAAAKAGVPAVGKRRRIEDEEDEEEVSGEEEEGDEEMKVRLGAGAEVRSGVVPLLKRRSRQQLRRGVEGGEASRTQEVRSRWSSGRRVPPHALHPR